MKENTNTDARKAAEEILNKSIVNEFKNVPDSAKTDFAKLKDCPTRTVAINAMLEFAKSRPATLDKGQGIAYCAMKPDGSIYYATEKLSDKDFTFWSPTLSDGKLFSSVEDLKDRLKEVDNYVIKTVLLNPLSEQPEAKATEAEQVEKIYSEEFLTWRGKWFVKDNMVYPWKNKQGVRYSDEDLHKSFEQAMRESPFKPSTR